MTETTTRPAQLTDAPRVAALLGQLGYPSTPEDVVQRLAHIGTHPDFGCWVAESNGRVLGFIGACTTPAFEMNGVFGRILALIVDPELQGLGVGRALVSVAESWMRARGAHEIFVHSGNHRTEAHDFYRRLGYEATGVRFKKAL